MRTTAMVAAARTSLAATTTYADARSSTTSHTTVADSTSRMHRSGSSAVDSGGITPAAVALGFASGAVGSLVGSYDSSYAYPDTHLLEINGRDGRVLVEDTVRRYTFNRAGNETAQVWQAGYFNDTERMFHRLFDRHADAYLAALRAGEQPPIHARAGRRALARAHAIMESFETGRRVSATDEV